MRGKKKLQASQNESMTVSTWRSLSNTLSHFLANLLCQWFQKIRTCCQISGRRNINIFICFIWWWLLMAERRGDRLWCNLLKVSRVNVDDNFAWRMVSWLNIGTFIMMTNNCINFFHRLKCIFCRRCNVRTWIFWSTKRWIHCFVFLVDILKSK